MNNYEVTSFYRFMEIDPSRVTAVKSALDELGSRHALKGLIVLATEGVNGTVTGARAEIDLFQERLKEIFAAGDFSFKRSSASNEPFRNYRVKIRKEIVTARTELDADERARLDEGKLSPLEWHQAMDELSSEEAVLLDTRNRYETRLGMFDRAVDPGLENFQQFDRFLAAAAIPKDKSIYMYCTGGIRCEKASQKMKRLGYRNVFQLDGGILRYLEAFPNAHFHGECFVFDGRVALDQDLNPTREWVFCPHCGDPGNIDIACGHCGCSAKICGECQPREDRRSCSKNCAYHIRLHRERSERGARNRKV